MEKICQLLIVLLIPLFLSTMQGCAAFSSSGPTLAEADTPAKRSIMAYNEISILSKTIVGMVRSGVITDDRQRTLIADKLSQLILLTDLYTLSEVKDLTIADQADIKKRFSDNNKAYIAALEVYNSYEPGPQGQLKLIILVNTLTLELLTNLKENDNGGPRSSSSRAGIKSAKFLPQLRCGKGYQRQSTISCFRQGSRRAA